MYGAFITTPLPWEELALNLSNERVPFESALVTYNIFQNEQYLRLVNIPFQLFDIDDQPLPALSDKLNAAKRKFEQDKLISVQWYSTGLHDIIFVPTIQII